MAVQNNELTIKELKDSIQYQLKHPYVAKFIPEPVINEDKIVFLTSIVSGVDRLSEEQKRKYVIATMLVQIALDTHELVTVSSDGENEELRKSRQLTVLAGDYYSGLYYYLLSKIGDVSMIQTLATAIKDINEYKMKLYNDQLNIGQMVEYLRDIESLLIRRVAEFLGRTSILNTAADWLVATRLRSENVHFRKREVAPILDLIMKHPSYRMTGGQALSTIEKFVEKYMTLVEHSLSTWPSRFANVKDYLNQHLYHSIMMNHHAVEEG
ncbi:heptaprenyl diphosphate synthase component 1 [Pontibacillus halophilus]|nr:heptaprenyl diphosphate synthase component 1 [Pontibacillus halophilus]